MPISEADLFSRLSERFPNSDVVMKDLAGDNDHWQAEIASAEFAGLNRIQQHKKVQAAVEDLNIHALAIKTTIKEQKMIEIPQTKEEIDSAVKSNDVVLFMKGTKKFPMCGFSSAVVSILNNMSVDYQDFNVMESEDLRQNVKDYTDWPTIPQLYVKGEFIGGCDIIREMFETGELKEVLGKA